MLSTLIVVAVFWGYAAAICFLVYAGAGTLIGFSVVYLLMASGVEIRYRKDDE